MTNLLPGGPILQVVSSLESTPQMPTPPRQESSLLDWPSPYLSPKRVLCLGKIPSKIARISRLWRVYFHPQALEVFKVEPQIAKTVTLHSCCEAWLDYWIFHQSSNQTIKYWKTGNFCDFLVCLLWLFSALLEEIPRCTPYTMIPSFALATPTGDRDRLLPDDWRVRLMRRSGPSSFSNAFPGTNAVKTNQHWLFFIEWKKNTSKSPFFFFWGSQN